MSRIIYTSRSGNAYRRPSRIKWRVLFAVILVAAFAGGIIYLFRLSQWQITDIKIGGTKVLTEEEIREHAGKVLEGNYFFVFPKRSILLAPQNTILGQLKQSFPRIGTISITKKYPRTLIISLQERELWGIFCVQSADQRGLNASSADLRGNEDDCVYIDKTGFAFERAPTSVGSLIKKIKIDEAKLVLASYAVESDLMNDILRLSGRVEDQIKSSVVSYELFSQIPREVRMTVAEGFTLYLNRDDDIENALRVLKLVLDEEIKDRRSELDYVDLRFGNKVFYKFRQ